MLTKLKTALEQNELLPTEYRSNFISVEGTALDIECRTMRSCSSGNAYILACNQIVGFIQALTRKGQRFSKDMIDDQGNPVASVKRSKVATPLQDDIDETNQHTEEQKARVEESKDPSPEPPQTAKNHPRVLMFFEKASCSNPTEAENQALEATATPSLSVHPDAAEVQQARRIPKAAAPPSKKPKVEKPSRSKQKPVSKEAISQVSRLHVEPADTRSRRSAMLSSRCTAATSCPR